METFSKSGEESTQQDNRNILAKFEKRYIRWALVCTIEPVVLALIYYFILEFIAVGSIRVIIAVVFIAIFAGSVAFGYISDIWRCPYCHRPVKKKALDGKMCTWCGKKIFK